MNSASPPMAHKFGVSSLWWGWVAAPTWWLTQFEIRYAFVHWSCTHALHAFVSVLGLIAVAVSIAIVLWTVRCFKNTRDDEAMRFVSVGGVWIAIAFALLTAVQILPDVFIEVCRV
jgi:hypothetical protein